MQFGPASASAGCERPVSSGRRADFSSRPSDSFRGGFSGSLRAAIVAGVRSPDGKAARGEARRQGAAARPSPLRPLGRRKAARGGETTATSARPSPPASVRSVEGGAGGGAKARDLHAAIVAGVRSPGAGAPCARPRISNPGARGATRQSLPPPHQVRSSANLRSRCESRPPVRGTTPAGRGDRRGVKGGGFRRRREVCEERRGEGRRSRPAFPRAQVFRTVSSPSRPCPGRRRGRRACPLSPGSR